MENEVGDRHRDADDRFPARGRHHTLCVHGRDQGRREGVFFGLLGKKGLGSERVEVEGHVRYLKGKMVLGEEELGI